LSVLGLVVYAVGALPPVVLSRISARAVVLEEIFEWGGSLAMGRPVSDIPVGWNVLAGYMWPLVLLAYASSNLVVGLLLHLGKPDRAP
jgi:hypothetical protein